MAAVTGSRYSRLPRYIRPEAPFAFLSGLAIRSATLLPRATGQNAGGSSASERAAELADEAYATCILDALDDENRPARRRLPGLASDNPTNRGFHVPLRQAQYSHRTALPGGTGARHRWPGFRAYMCT
jgi:hypothetical protein